MRDRQRIVTAALGLSVLGASLIAVPATARAQGDVPTLTTEDVTKQPDSATKAYAKEIKAAEMTAKDVAETKATSAGYVRVTTQRGYAFERPDTWVAEPLAAQGAPGYFSVDAIFKDPKTGAVATAISVERAKLQSPLDISDPGSVNTLLGTMLNAGADSSKPSSDKSPKSPAATPKDKSGKGDKGDKGDSAAAVADAATGTPAPAAAPAAAKVPAGVKIVDRKTGENPQTKTFWVRVKAEGTGQSTEGAAVPTTFWVQMQQTPKLLAIVAVGYPSDQQKAAGVSAFHTVRTLEITDVAEPAPGTTPQGEAGPAAPTEKKNRAGGVRRPE